MKETTNSKIDLGKTIIAIRSQFDAANRMDEIEIARERCKILCKANGLNWWMILYIELDVLRMAIEQDNLDNFLL